MTTEIILIEDLYNGFCLILMNLTNNANHNVVNLLARSNDRAVAQAVSLWLPTAAARVCVRAGMWHLWWTKQHWGRFSQSASVSAANHHSTDFSSIIITRGWHNKPTGGRSAECTQLHSTPNYNNYLLTYGAEPFLRSCQLCSHSENSQ
jgi:hypothetical protein